MSNQLGAADEESGNDSPEGDGSYFAWEFANEERLGPRPFVAGLDGAIESPVRKASKELQPIVIDAESARLAGDKDGRSKPGATPVNLGRQNLIPADGQFGPARSNFIRDQLDKSLDLWWAKGELPPRPLLRDGLLMLEAGASASESQRTLLLRAALAYRRGIQTALRYQVDGERVALVIAEALVEWGSPLESTDLPKILEGEEQIRSLLKTELERSRILLTGEPRSRAEAALEVLSQMSNLGQRVMPELSVEGQRRLRQFLLLLLLLAMVGFVFWERRQSTPDGMISMPGAVYAIVGADRDAPVGSARLDAYFIDQFEVTNHEYRSCVELGKCAWPLHPNSSTRKDYFTNPAFDDYPIIGVTQAMAEAYCAWQEKRLPSAAEWQAAAGVSPTTGQAYLFPWGESFDQQRTNSALSGYGDTVVVGSFRPAGDSPSGAVDMAGNVAEWTSTPISDTHSPAMATVKGGSFMSDPDALQVGAIAKINTTQGFPEIGFRCARSHLLTQS